MGSGIATWQEWFSSRISGREKKQVAKAIGVHGTYLSKIEKDGLIPSRELARAIGEYFGNAEEGLLMAGYAPEEVLLDELDPSLRESILELMECEPSEQAAAGIWIGNACRMIREIDEAKRNFAIRQAILDINEDLFE